MLQQIFEIHPVSATLLISIPFILSQTLVRVVSLPVIAASLKLYSLIPFLLLISVNCIIFCSSVHNMRRGLMLPTVLASLIAPSLWEYRGSTIFFRRFLRRSLVSNNLTIFICLVSIILLPHQIPEATPGTLPGPKVLASNASSGSLTSTFY